MKRKQLAEKVSEIAPGTASDWDRCLKSHLVKVYGWAKGMGSMTRKKVEPTSKKTLLKEAKRIGLFSLNRRYRRYEIHVPINDYEDI